MLSQLLLLATISASPSAVLLEMVPLEEGASSVGAVMWEGQLYSARQVPQQRVDESRRLTEKGSPLRPPDPQFYYTLGIVVALITAAGLMAGCTMGILSLDQMTLTLKQLEGTPDEKRWASALLPVVTNHHHLLVALLLVNAGANEALPIFLDRLVDTKTAILLSVTCVLIFGEIIPSAIMTGSMQARASCLTAAPPQPRGRSGTRPSGCPRHS